MAIPREEWAAASDPAALEEAARAWRTLQEQANTAHVTINDATRDVVGQDWESPAADAYDDHRDRLTRDIEGVADLAGSIASKLESLATSLRSSTGDELAEDLVVAEARFKTKRGDLREIADRWRQVRLVNLNVGSGNDRNPFQNKDGMNPDEIYAMAELLVSEKADIVTMQEVFKEDMPRLIRALEEITGDSWDYQYAEASTKFRANSDYQPFGLSFGNAVLVREDGPISGLEGMDREKLDVDGPWVVPGDPNNPPPNIPSPGIPPRPGDVPTSGGTPGRIEDGEGRVAAHGEVTFE